MFRTKKTKIVSPKVESVLEVEVPEEFVAIDFVTVLGNVRYIHYGSLTDYDGKEYQFEWDINQQRLCRLTGSKVTQFIWDSSTQVLEKHFKPVETPVEKLLEPIVAKQVGSAVSLIIKGLKELDTKVANIKPQVIQQVPRVEAPLPRVERQPVTEQAVDVDEDRISLNAMKYLQESQSDDLGVDYLSL